MEVPWRQLKDEARRLALEIGASAGREHHSLVKNAAALAAIRVQGVPPEHRDWVWPILLHQQNLKLQRQSSSFATYNQLLHVDEQADETMQDETQQHSQQQSQLSPQQQDASGLQQAQELAMERFSHLNPFQERKIKRILVAYTKSKDVFYYCHVRYVLLCLCISHGRMLTFALCIFSDAYYTGHGRDLRRAEHVSRRGRRVLGLPAVA